MLARTGALNGPSATTHWLAAKELARQYPEIDVNPDVLYVDNGRILTSAGAAAGLDLCLHVIRRDLGAEIAALTLGWGSCRWNAPADRPSSLFTTNLRRPDDNTAMGPLLAWIEKNLHKELSLPAIARHVAISTRTLSRRFLERVGATPAQWVATPAYAVPSKSSKRPAYRLSRSRHIRGLARPPCCACISLELSGQILSRTGAV